MHCHKSGLRVPTTRMPLLEEELMEMLVVLTMLVVPLTMEMMGAQGSVLRLCSCACARMLASATATCWAANKHNDPHSFICIKFCIESLAQYTIHVFL